MNWRAGPHSISIVQGKIDRYRPAISCSLVMVQATCSAAGSGAAGDAQPKGRCQAPSRFRAAAAKQGQILQVSPGFRLWFCAQIVVRVLEHDDASENNVIVRQATAGAEAVRNAIVISVKCLSHQAHLCTGAVLVALDGTARLAGCLSCCAHCLPAPAS